MNPVALCGKHRTQLGRGKLDLSFTGEDAADPYLLPEDGELDAWAAHIAAKGYRRTPVRLTERERMLAVAMIIRGDPDDVTTMIMDRLGVSRAAAWTLAEKVSREGIDLEGVEF